MKILMILDHEFLPDIRVENEMEVLAAAGHEMHLACYTRKGRPAYELINNWHIHRTNIPSLVYKSSVAALTYPAYFRFWKKFVSGLLENEKFDAIHVHDLPLSQVGADLARKYRLPLTIDLHENWPAYLRISTHTQSLLGRLLSPNKKWIDYEKKVLKSANNIVVVVQEAAERLASIGIDKGKIKVVSNSLNLNHFNIDTGEESSSADKGSGSNDPDPSSENNTTPQETVLFYAGGLTIHRGLQVVIKAIAGVADKRPDIRFWILGEGSYRVKLEELTRSLGLEEQVIFKGWQPYEEMTRMMLKSDYTLIPHLRSDHTDSTIPHKLFQYMYAGKPIIASDCKPIERIVNETDSGYIYASDSPAELSEILLGLDRNNIDHFIENGRTWVHKKYNWEVDSSVLKEIYRS